MEVCDDVILGSVTQGNNIFRSDDYGVTWSILDTPFDNGFVTKLSYIDGAVIVVGFGGKIFRSSDKGLTWGSLIPNLFRGEDYIKTIVTVNNTSIAVGDNGNIAKSTDNGLTWTVADRPI